MQILRIFVQKFHYQWRLHDKTLSHFEVFHIFEPTIFLFFSNPQTLPIPDDLTTFALSEGYMKYFLLPNDDEISSFVTLVQKKCASIKSIWKVIRARAMIDYEKIQKRDIALLALDVFIQYFCIKVKILVGGLGRDKPQVEVEI